LATEGQKLPGAARVQTPGPSDSQPDAMAICHGDPVFAYIVTSSI